MKRDKETVIGSIIIIAIFIAVMVLWDEIIIATKSFLNTPLSGLKFWHILLLASIFYFTFKRKK